MGSTGEGLNRISDDGAMDISMCWIGSAHNLHTVVTSAGKQTFPRDVADMCRVVRGWWVVLPGGTSRRMFQYEYGSMDEA